MNYLSITQRYYAHWLGVPAAQLNCSEVCFAESAERGVAQKGYPQPLPLYIYCGDTLFAKPIVVSYSRTIVTEINAVRGSLQPGMSIDEIIILITKHFKTSVNHNSKFCYQESLEHIDVAKVIRLETNHYRQYYDFFMALHTDAKPDSWLEEYFSDICRSGFAFGIFDNAKLVCVSDVPDMPYLSDECQEIGINTLKDYRCCGYAKAVAHASAQAIVSNGKCPQWSCAADNGASAKLARNLGFMKLADVVTVGV